MSDRDTDRQLSEEEAGELRQRLRESGWSSDLAWANVGSGSAATAQGEARRTIVYLASLRAVDGGAAKVWQEGDVPAPAEADAREVFVTSDEDSEWHSEVLEAPATTVAGSVETGDEDSTVAGEEEAASATTEVA